MIVLGIAGLWTTPTRNSTVAVAQDFVAFPAKFPARSRRRRFIAMSASGRQLPVAALLTFQLGNLLSLSDRPDSARSAHCPSEVEIAAEGLSLNTNVDV